MMSAERYAGRRRSDCGVPLGELPGSALSPVHIHPSFDALYYSFYLYGLLKVLKGAGIHYTTEGFPENSRRCLLVRMTKPGRMRLCIDALDGPEVEEALMGWCEVYAKINVDPSSKWAGANGKLMCIGPSFGVRAFGAAETLLHAAATLRYFRTIRQKREHLAGYYRQWAYRLPEPQYQPAVSRTDYVFFTGSLWKREQETNRHRASFIRACKSLTQVAFEGGFAPRERKDVPGFEDITVQCRYSFPEYLSKIKLSAVAFNTPAVLSCHGWKLGEFLALGKAIVSTPLVRALPAPLVHGEHLHLVDGSEASIREAVERIIGDAAYKRKLERNARQYYEQFLSPEAVVGHLRKVVGEPGL
jgi:glycosyltransferase involved in cell wall biosynthesis